MGTTSDHNDPRLTHGVDDPADGPVPQAEMYWVLPPEERAKGFVRPVNQSYWHTTCGKITTMRLDIAETYARDPKAYSATYCEWCKLHRPVGPDGEFHWCDPDNRERQTHTQPKVGT